ncbi:MAG: glycoside hydrolase family 27 protein [Acidobacteriota bacterium]|nr:glycoside hydrolase family 27 protein [Acidobacteriota bacterium]
MKFFTLTLLFALPSLAADITGNWLAKMTTPDGNVRQTYYDLKQNGQTITGFIRTNSADRPVEGTIDDAGNVALTSSFGGGNRPPMKTMGKLEADGLHLTMRMRPNQPPMEIVATKAAPGEGGPPARIAPPALHKVPANGLAKTPPMGWNSWNKFAGRVTEEDVKGMADAIVSSGMKDAGYIYVNIDDTWEAGRDAQGNIQTNKKFPDMKALADYVHSKGLKIGIYSSPGPATCAGYEGSYGHEAQDAKTYAAWGIDYLKYDWCGAARIYKDDDMQAVYQKMGHALQATGRPILYSLCQYGREDVWKWGPDVGGNSWRTTGDIRDTWDSMSKIGFEQAPLAPYAAPGHWNDPDMLEIGNGGMTADEYRTHMSLWSMLAAPLLAGNDIRNETPETFAILTNREVIALDQDKLGKQATRLSQTGDQEVWVKDLADGSKAYGLFNRGAAPAQMKLPGTGKVRDLWSKRDITATEFTVPAHGVALLKVSR